MLLVAFVVVPPAAAYLLTDKLYKMLLFGVLIAALSSFLGYASAVALDVSIGGMMAVYTGVFLVLAFLFGPRYELFAQENRRGEQRRRNAERTLLVHLYNHEDSASTERENVVSALHSHLRWSEGRANEIIARGLEQNLVPKAAGGEHLYLTPKGRILAQEVLEPWREPGRLPG